MIMPQVTFRAYALVLLLIWCGCTVQPADRQEQERIMACIQRYNQLLADGYRSLNMTALQEVATEGQATKPYLHMAALGEGKLRLDSKLKAVDYLKLSVTRPDQAAVETRERWDFRHLNMVNGQTFAEERDFIYTMSYTLKKDRGRWIITDAVTLDGASTTTVLPWPSIDRSGKHAYPPGLQPGPRPVPAAP